MFKSIQLVFLFSLISVLSFARDKVIFISNQSSFEKISSLINDAAGHGFTDITIKVSSGTYFFHEKHISLGTIKNDSLSIRIIGKDVLIVPEGREVNTNKVLNDYSYNSTVIDITNRKRIKVWSDLEYADSKVEVLDEDSKLCRIKCSKLNSRDVVIDDAFIMLTAWCRTYYYHIQSIDGPYVYFIADNLAPGIKRSGRFEYNVNNDVMYAYAIPRFRVCNLKPLNVGEAYICDAQSFLWAVGVRLKSFEINGFTFLGNKTMGDLESSSCSYLVFNNCKAESITVQDCCFIGQNSRVIAISKTDNVHILDSKFYNNFRYGITEYNSCKNTEIINNYFEENGEDLSYDRCISCSGSNYYIANNSFINYGYCGISVGLYYTASIENEPSGVVEYNTLLYTDERMKELWRYSIMDSGAIYTWTQNIKSIIRFNRIQNYGGVSFNNGIYCDDGTKGVSIYGNIITGIVNGSAIHLRRFSIADPYVGRGNISNSIHNNVIEGNYVFEGNECENDCFKGENYVLTKEGFDFPNHVVKNIPNAMDDISIPYLGIKRGKIKIGRSGYKLVVRGELKGYFRKYLSR